MAVLCGVTHSSVANWEKPFAAPRPQMFRKLAKVLRVAPKTMAWRICLLAEEVERKRLSRG